MDNKFYIGLDIGTESVGYAATDGEYNVLKSCGKPLMGARLFDEAKTAVERRTKRADKVRKYRKRERIRLLQTLFNDEINKIDPLFFIRLSTSSFWEDDKKAVNEKLDLNSLFSDSDYTDYNYFRNDEGQHIGIFHLRKALMDPKTWEKDKKPDLRLVYLACHHILKNRGHFLWNVENVDFSGQAEDLIHRINNKLNILFSNFDDDCSFVKFNLSIPKDINDINNVFNNDFMGKKAKQDAFKKLIFADTYSKKECDSILKAITGGKFSLIELFDFDINNPVEGEKADNTFTFESEWDIIAPTILQNLADDEKFGLVELLKEFYDYGKLNSVLKNQKSISEAMVKRFEDHKEDLKIFKSLIKEVFSNEKGKNSLYYKIFRSKKEYVKKNDLYIGNYANYIGSSLIDGKEIVKKVDKEGFYKFLLEEFKANNLIVKKGNQLVINETFKLTDIQKDNLQKILDKIENGTFLPKLRNKDNGTIPFQIHRNELEKILDNASKYYTFLNKIDSDENSSLVINGKVTKDITVKDKIISLISFRVPYYVGRLNTYKNNDKRPVWAVRKKTGVKITPWTFDSVIDKEKSEDAFITRMLSRCTYLVNETVIPKNSLLYSKFSVLNELNNLKINGSKIDVSLKQDIYNNLFTRVKNVTVSALLKYLKSKGDVYTDLEASNISGLDKEGKGFNSTLSSLITAMPIIESLMRDYKMTREKAEEIIDNVIQRQVIHSDKRMVENYIKIEYPELASDCNIIKQLKGLNYSGFGNLSKKFLTGLSAVDSTTGEYNTKSILDLLWETNENLQQIIAGKDDIYGVRKWIDENNDIEDNEFSYEDIASSYASPSVKRGVWETIKIVDEIIKLNDNKIPDKIFVEVTRYTGVKDTRTFSRKVQLEKKYKEIKKESIAITNKAREILDIKTENELRSEKMYLYLLQGGKCAYSGDEISLQDLFNDNKYDIDHIIPQALIKDDSIDNKVLVKKELNNKKSKNYPLNKTSDIYSKINILKPLWGAWLKAGLINHKKHERLIRTSDLTEKELEDFIARQLVFTGQTVTLVCSLLKKKFSNLNDNEKMPEIVYSKAEHVSDFRKKFNIVKSRDINDIHHAHDAYLNIVVGNTYNQRFNHYIDFWKSNINKFSQFSQNHLFEYDVKDAWVLNLDKRPKREDFGCFKDKYGHYPKGTYSAYMAAFKDWLEKGESIQKVKKVLNKSWYLVTRKVVENKGSFYDETLYGVDIKQKQALKNNTGNYILMADKAAAIPLKGLKINPRFNYKKYGYFKSKTPAYFMIVEHTVMEGTKKNKQEVRQRQFLGISILDKNRIEKDIEKNGDNARFLVEEYGFIDPKIIVKKVYKNTLFNICEVECRLSGWNGQFDNGNWKGNVFFTNAKEFYGTNFSNKYVKLISKFNKMVKEKVLVRTKYEKDICINEILISDNNKGTNSAKITKEDNLKLFYEIRDSLNRFYGKETKVSRYSGKSIGLPDIVKEINLVEENFKEMPIAKQVDFLTAMVVGMNCAPPVFDFSSLGNGYAKNKGKIQPSLKITYPLVLIQESITGHKRKKTQIFPF